MKLWNVGHVKVLDVRRAVMEAGEALRGYRLPASAFMFGARGRASIAADGQVYAADRFHVLHCGKGGCLDIVAEDEAFEYYTIYYRAALPVSHRTELARLMERDNPFQAQYGFSPLHPIVLLELASAMHREWQRPGELERFHVQSLFYRFVYESTRQMRDQEISVRRPDIAAQAVRYIEEHYREPITMESLAAMLNYSSPYLAKQFKKSTGRSLIDYLIHTRIERAMELLAHTEATGQEVALSVGYADMSYFIRVFKKHAGVTPGQFKMRFGGDVGGADRPIVRLRSSNVRDLSRRYIVNGDNHSQYSQGEFAMRKYQKPSIALTLLVCFSLLLSACSNGTNANAANESAAGSASAAPQQTERASAPAGGETFVYQAANGNIEVPRNPQRIVVLSHTYVGYFVALGIEPVGAPTMTMSNTFLKGKIDQVEDIGAWSSFDIEKIVGLKPDLIIALNSMDNLGQIEKIAPTVGINYGERNYKEQLIEFGKLTNREKEAREWVERWVSRIAEAKPKVLEAVGDRTVSVMSLTQKGAYVYGYGFGRGTEILYDEFGLKSPEGFDLAQGSAELSFETLPDLAGDYIFTTPETGETEDVYDQPLWRQLPAVKNDRVFMLEQSAAAFNDPLTLESIFPVIVDSLLKGNGQ
ncbi:AraC family transcriptional regulator [Cohnella sp. GCM10027633]|uniref:AraC family transcriptional regulator n=1 Tax=unclassified Cohnella TaxID=2636738 RepID=UPI00363D687F